MFSACFYSWQLGKFLIRKTINESSLVQSGCWDDNDQLKEINKAGKAAKAIEIRNNLNNGFDYDAYIY